MLQHDTATGEYIICSGTGPTADWYRNLRATPSRSIQIKNREWVPQQRLLEGDEAATRFAVYEAHHAKAARRLLESMGNSYDGSDEGRLAMMPDMPMVAFTDHGPEPD